MDRSEHRHKWSRKINTKPVNLEREVFPAAGCERAFVLFMDSCCFFKECSGDRETCGEPLTARPAPEAIAVDVYSTVRPFGFPIDVRTEYDQKMDRLLF